MRSQLTIDVLRIAWLKHQLVGQSAKQSPFARSVSGLIMHHKGAVQRGFHYFLLTFWTVTQADCRTGWCFGSVRGNFRMYKLRTRLTQKGSGKMFCSVALLPAHPCLRQS
jgi:hypothetical protein